MKIVDYTGAIRDSEDIMLAEKLIELRKNKNTWVVLDKLVGIWAKKFPHEVRGLKKQIDDYRSMLVDKKYAQTQGGRLLERRFTLALPEKLYLLIRSVYKANELPTDSLFFRNFAKRYRFFQIPEKL